MVPPAGSFLWYVSGDVFVSVCVYWRVIGKQGRNDDPVISPGATSALVEGAASEKPHPTFLENSTDIHHPDPRPLVENPPPRRAPLPPCIH